MLQSLHIENVAVIEKTDITFGKGLTVLTGETGAGKSIVIDAMGAVLGGRATVGKNCHIGAEYLLGKRTNMNNEDRSANRVNLLVQYNF